MSDWALSATTVSVPGRAPDPAIRTPAAAAAAIARSLDHHGGKTAIAGAPARAFSPGTVTLASTTTAKATIAKPRGFPGCLMVRPLHVSRGRITAHACGDKLQRC